VVSLRFPFPLRFPFLIPLPPSFAPPAFCQVYDQGVDEQNKEMALREAAINTTLNHQNIVATYNCDLQPLGTDKASIEFVAKLALQAPRDSLPLPFPSLQAPLCTLPLPSISPLSHAHAHLPSLLPSSLPSPLSPPLLSSLLPHRAGPGSQTGRCTSFKSTAMAGRSSTPFPSGGSSTRPPIRQT
jgi:hypothetical protein